MAHLRVVQRVPSINEQLRIDLKCALGDTKTIGSFAAFGSLYNSDLIDVGLDVELCVNGIGPVELPLTATDTEALISLSLSQENHKTVAPASSQLAEWRNFWDVGPSLVSTGPAWEDLLDLALKKTKVALGLATDTPYASALSNFSIRGWGLTGNRIVPHLHQLVVQKWNSSIKSAVHSSENVNTHVATVVIVLPSSHDGGQIDLSHDSGSKTFHTASASATDYQYLAFSYNATCKTDQISSGNRAALVYRLYTERNEAESTQPQSCNSTSNIKHNEGGVYCAENASEDYSSEDQHRPQRRCASYEKPPDCRLASFRKSALLQAQTTKCLERVLASWTRTKTDNGLPSVLVYTWTMHVPPISRPSRNSGAMMRSASVL